MQRTLEQDLLVEMKSFVRSMVHRVVVTWEGLVVVEFEEGNWGMVSRQFKSWEEAAFWLAENR